MKRLFFGGIHPSDRKELSEKTAPSSSLSPKQVVIPLRQHIGAACVPLVSPGDRVLRYQKIGDGEGLCVPVHAPVSGIVTAIRPWPHPSGGMAEAIVIENDFRGESIPLFPAEENDPEAVLHAIREAGLVGLGGAAFPGNAKAVSAMGHVDTLIANGCECEPYITADDCLLRTCPGEVLEGLAILRRLLKPERTVLAVEDNKGKAIAAIRTVLADYPGIELKILPTRYPQGGEKQLILSVTGREVPPGKLPVAVGCGVFNVSTCAAVYRGVRLGQPLTERIVTVTGEAVAKPQNFTVPIGTSFQDVIEAAGGLPDGADRVIAGGPMMGTAQSCLDVPVIKATSCVLCLRKEEAGEVKPVCLRCGRCAAVCPMRLLPLYLYRYIQAEDLKKCERLHLTDCMECGCCAYACPGKLPLVACFRRGKQILREGSR